MQSENIKYKSLIPYKVSALVSLIIETKEIDFNEATEYLYKSRLYSYLSDEATKLWHLSAVKLFDILEVEKKTNTLQFPDFV